MNSAIENQVAFEVACQPLLDAQYKARGWRVDRSVACQDYDLVLTKDDWQKEIRVEEKLRAKNYGDFLVELVQDIASGNAGWFSKTKCDLLSYAAIEGGQITTMRVIKWPPFKRWACDYMAAHNSKVQYRWSTAGYGITLNVALQWGDLPAELIAYEYQGDK